MMRTLLSILAVLLLSTPAFAGAVGDAKDAGLVGEKPDGYLGLVNESSPADVEELVDETNAKRRSVYAGIAKKEGISVEAVAARSGQRLVDEAPAGHFVLMGTWKKKEK